MSQATAIHAEKDETATPATGCTDVVSFTRLRYYHGRALTALDLRQEQASLVAKRLLHNKLLHGWGIVCGLEVEVVADAEDCYEQEEGRGSSVLRVGSGAAIDCEGHDVIVRHPREVKLASMLSEEELDELGERPGSVYLTLCYHEELIEPARPLVTADCEPFAACQYGRVCETYRLCASTVRPDPGPACEPCCGACGSLCLELAEIVDFDPAAGLRPDQIVTTGRRALALHDLAEISGINWVHAGVYGREEATRLLAEGLEVRFSRPVKVASLQRGVVEVTTVEAGAGRAAGMYEVSGEFRDLPATELTDRFVYRSTTGETLQYGDRVKIVVHGDHVFDECCRAADLDNGGSVPTLEDAPVSPLSEPDRLCPPRRSGDGTEGGDFVSWIFVAERGEKQ